jgi:asparaginyl-tRNA synthetase
VKTGRRKNMKQELEEQLKDVKKRPELFHSDALAAVAKVEAALVRGARQYFDRQGYTEVMVPHITKATGSCENIMTLFGIEYFKQPGYLVQTGQLYLESLIPKLGKVCCIGPSFRAEPKVDERHLTEFPLLEFELPGDFGVLLTEIEKTINAMVKTALHDASDALDYLGVDRSKINVDTPFKHVCYTTAIADLKEFGVKWGDDLKNEHEKFLVEGYGNKPLFITHYPKQIKFFNMRENDNEASMVNSADLILPYGGEAVGSAEREFRYEPLKQRLQESNMMKQLIELGGGMKDFEWYLNFVRDHSNQVHSGCGIGLNRVTQYVLQSNDIRACTVFPMNKDSLM